MHKLHFCLPIYLTLCVAAVCGMEEPDGEIAYAKYVIWSRPPADYRSPNGHYDPYVYYRWATIDEEGNLLPLLDHYLNAGPVFSGPGPDISSLISSRSSSIARIYEHRSGGLIVGNLCERGFVPEIGSEVLAYQSFMQPGALKHPVYNQRINMPDYYTTPERLKMALTLTPAPLKNPEPPLGGVPAGYELVSFERAYQSLKGRRAWSVRVMNDTAEFGQLQANGDLLPDYGLPVMPRSAVPKPAKIVGPSNGLWHFAYTLPRNGKEVEDVYEFRSNRLIKGKLHDSGCFSPEISSKITDFKDYKPGVDLRIYNLPGVLRAVQKKP